MKQTLIFVLISYSISSFCQITNESFGNENFKNGICLTENERQVIGQNLSANIAQLKREGIIKETKSRKVVEFGWPLRKSDNLDWASYYGISNYVDQNTSSVIQDHNCGSRSYDGHKGTDIFTWPFPWYLFENDQVEVVAAAEGVIVSLQDGNFDQNCQWQGAGNWNAVYIQHDDGSVAWYGHLKENSLTTKTFGQRVEKGEYLGIVGSSGRSTGPHLHFEIYDDDIYSRAHLIDPYKNFCNRLNDDSWWQNQKPYRESKLIALATHSKEGVHACPVINEKPNFSKTFSPGSRMVAGAFHRDHLIGQKTEYSILNPNGDIEDAWSRLQGNDFNASWWYFNFNIPSNAMPGIWSFEADFLDQHESVPFYVCTTTIDNDNDGFCVDVDCDDDNPNINPEAEEIPDNGIDENCDGEEAASSAKNEFQNDLVSLFPNPAGEQLFLEFENLKLFDFQIFNVLGQIQMSGKIESNQSIDIKKLDEGSYFILLQSTDSQALKIVKRFIKS